MHHRLEPKPHRFNYDIFMFYLDLDELDALTSRFRFMSRNRLNLFSFRDDDHMILSGKTTKENMLQYVASHGIDLTGGRIMLLTHLATAGYTFNPVSFYFCFDVRNNPVCAVAEVGNTYKELKPYFFGAETIRNGAFFSQKTKYFYVSPFVDMDTEFAFQLTIPDATLDIKIDDFKNDQKIFVSTLKGKQKSLSDGALLWFFFRFPFITLQIITLIHWQALKLYLKKLPYHKKTDHMDLQREVLNGRNA